MPETLDEMMMLTIRIDRRIRERSLEKLPAPTAFAVPAPSPLPIRAEKLMQLGSSRLSAAERSRRRNKSLYRGPKVDLKQSGSCTNYLSESIFPSHYVLGVLSASSLSPDLSAMLEPHHSDPPPGKPPGRFHVPLPLCLQVLQQFHESKVTGHPVEKKTIELLFGTPRPVALLCDLGINWILTQAQFTKHNEQVCSTWGYYHFKELDGEIYYYKGKCKYVFASHCKGSKEDFNILFQRTEEDGVPVISYIYLKIHEATIEIHNNSITLDGELVNETPVDKSRVLIDRIGNNWKIAYSSDIYFMWNGGDSILLKLNRNKYEKQTCGMCGDFNGIPGLTFDGIETTAVQFGNLQKRNGPTEDCPDVPPSTSTSCKDADKICKNTLTSAAFSSCNMLVDPTSYIDACVQDLCRCSSKNKMSCLCKTFAEYSRQCTHAGGVPENWRTPKLCPQTCPFNMVHKECGSPCLNTCSNTERSMVCEDHGVDGCFCPKDTVLDDINNTGCIPQENCFCVYDGKKYSPGSAYSAPCRACTCSKGKWKCKELPCTSSCSVEGGSHITTFDGLRYNINGDCSYVLAKHSTGHDFVLLGDLRRCGISNSKSCLKGVVLVLSGGEIVLSVKENCVAFLNWMTIQLPVSVANMTISQPTSFYLNIHTAFGLSLMVQCVPVMQVYIDIDSSFEHQTCGLCGNYNNIQADDFKALSGVIEGTAAAFVNTWKTLANCPNIKNSYEDPCSLNVEKEKYAQYWCALLTSPTGPFSACHSSENPLIYHANCMTDTCSGTDSEECMCAVLSSYAFACAKKGVLLTGWRNTVCQKYTQTCKESQEYRYNVNQFQPTCRSLSEADATRNTKVYPVDGCVCSEGTYMNDNGDCVAAHSCPCYYQGNVMQSGEMIEENGIACTCEKGQLNCMGKAIKKTVCTHPLIYHNCTSAPKDTKGVECQKSCDTLDMDCYSPQCISGCVCPKGLVSNGKGDCIHEHQCPCIHNEAAYAPGSTIAVACNTCTCKNRKWQCTLKQCLGSCSVYGDGHHISFDNKLFTFSGSCEYTLVQDNCGENGGQSSFRVIIQNVQCGFNGTICSRTIKIFLGDEELRLDNEKIEVVKREEKNKVQFEVVRRGIYLILKHNDFFILWDTKSAIQIKLSSNFKRNVCGICGNYDDNANNDFTTRSNSVVENLIEFYNSWKTDPKCPDAHDIKNPCSINPQKKAWATKQCAIITSDVFQPCHPQVDPTSYYGSCISDSCSCGSGGDCECFCTAVAAYAQACSEKGVCIKWRTPTICPIFCDYYNDAGECAWHYRPCGDKCMKTCSNPKGECLYELSGLEGCYPSCPASKPYLNEDIMKCVPRCGCDDGNGNFYNYEENVPSKENCYSCKSTSTTPTTTACYSCHWTKWYNENHPSSDKDSGDEESFEIARKKVIKECSDKSYVQDVKCESSSYSGFGLRDLGQNGTCDIVSGLKCKNKDNPGTRIMCYDYKIQFYCCKKHPCKSTISSSSVTSETSTSTEPLLCVYGDSVYKVGSSIPQSPGSCHKCKCAATMKNSAEIICEPIVCNTECQMGYTYKEVDGQCCGTCVQEFCVLNNTVLIKPGNVWYPPGDKCTCYDCEPETFMVVKKVMSCPLQKPVNCDKGILVNFTSTDGCCTIQICEPRKCDIMKSWKVIESGGCSTNVTLTNCGGYCSSVSRHPNFPKMQKHDCTCCQATKTQTKKVQLDCNNGRKISYTFTDVLQCSCRGAACVFTE
ncbi:mucin-2-like [Pyxicephalus adspersus]|uniref:mucin-2-like n=1 Tax=Pyxicephalus adspersus TaxID=30357 RepID=UPI003B5BAD4D